MRISDWSSDVCSSDLAAQNVKSKRSDAGFFPDRRIRQVRQLVDERPAVRACAADREVQRRRQRSEEHTSELQSLMRISYAVFCLEKKKKATNLQSTLYTTTTLIMYPLQHHLLISKAIVDLLSTQQT